MLYESQCYTGFFYGIIYLDGDICMDIKLLVFREVKPEDAREWLILCNKVWRDAYSHIFPLEVFRELDNQLEERIKKFPDNFKNDNKTIAYVAEYDGKIV